MSIPLNYRAKNKESSKLLVVFSSVMLAVVAAFSWPPVYVWAFEAFRSAGDPGAYPDEWFERQPAVIATLCNSGTWIRPILGLASLYLLFAQKQLRERAISGTTALLAAALLLFELAIGFSYRTG